jgi:hypothetical protein
MIYRGVGRAKQDQHRVRKHQPTKLEVLPPSGLKGPEINGPGTPERWSYKGVTVPPLTLCLLWPGAVLNTLTPCKPHLGDKGYLSPHLAGGKPEAQKDEVIFSESQGQSGDQCTDLEPALPGGALLEGGGQGSCSSA